MITLKQIYTLLFLLGLFFIPFNEFDGLPFLGEYKDEAASYFFLLGFGVVCIESILAKKICFPYKNPLIIVITLFIIWSCVVTVINYDTVLNNFYKQTSGISRYIRQTISLLISAGCFTFLFWNVIKNTDLSKSIKQIRKVLLYSFVFVAIYGFFEIAIVYLGMGVLKPIWNLFEFFPFVNNSLHNGERVGISSVTWEIPALGNYLIFVTPWMLSYIFTENKLIKFIPSLVVVILMLFSNARAALVVIGIQLICFVFILLHDQRYRKITALGLKTAGITVFFLLILKSETIYKTVSERADQLNFSKNLTKSVSNKSRFGMQYAALQVFKENPVCGVGFGQGTYHMIPHYPYWATSKNWEFKYLYKNQQNKSFPPQYNIYSRLLAETGFTGFLLFLLLASAPVFYSLQFWKKADYQDKYIGVILLLSFLGFAINWFQLDFFKQYGFWLCLALLIKTVDSFKHNE